jgi:hypothetical protein
MPSILIPHILQKTLRQAKRIARKHRLENQSGAWSVRADKIRDALPRRQRYSSTTDLLRDDKNRSL